jgi:hypothetical protein
MDSYNPVSQGDYERILGVLRQNADKTFVKRILRPEAFPTLDLGNGSHATHRMAWTEAGGKYYVYPTVLMTPDRKLQDYGDSAFDIVKRTGNFIEFNTPDEADWFSRNYKGAWGGKMNNEPK